MRPHDRRTRRTFLMSAAAATAASQLAGTSTRRRLRPERPRADRHDRHGDHRVHRHRLRPPRAGRRARRRRRPVRGPSDARQGGPRRPRRRLCRLPGDPRPQGRRRRPALRARPLARPDVDRRHEGRQGGLLREADGPHRRRGARRDPRPEGDEGRLPGGQPVRQLDRHGPAQAGARIRGHRQAALRRTPGTTATRRWAPGNTRSRPTPRPRRSTGTASSATPPNARTTPIGSSDGGSTGTTARRSPATSSSTS